MKFILQGLCCVALLSLLAACSDKDDAKPKDLPAPKDTFAAPQLEALEKAKAVEETLRKQHEEQEKAMEEQGL